MAWIFNPFTGSFDFYVIGSTPAPAVDNVFLLENGDFLVTETADNIAKE
jgi:hypothetical protein